MFEISITDAGRMLISLSIYINHSSDSLRRRIEIKSCEGFKSSHRDDEDLYNHW